MIEATDLKIGQFVAFDDPPELVRDRQEWIREGLPTTLFTGHPGIITDDSPQHVLVDWCGLEDMYISFATGFSADYPDGPMRGLTLLSEQEYQERKRRILASQPPVPPPTIS